MRVLDVGCGPGDLSRYLAGLVGPDGEVVAMAQAIPGTSGAAPIRYDQVDLTGSLQPLGRFNAIVGRRVLMYLPDAADTVARLIALLRPGGLVAFQEHARVDLPAGAGKLPHHRRLYDQMWRTVEAEGGDVSFGLKLADALQGAGLGIEQAWCEGILLLPGEPSFLPVLAEVMLPRMLATGAATAAEVDLDRLAERLEDERLRAGSTIVWDLAMMVSGRGSARTQSSHLIHAPCG